MTDSSGAVVWSADYKPFGEATITVSTITNNLRFPGQYYDAETGLNYNYWRDYNPVIGRYVESDPIGIQQGSNHLYVYAENNPLLKTDPRGKNVYSCVRPLDATLGSLIYQYLGLGYEYLWVDSMNAGFGLGPKMGYKALATALGLSSSPIDFVPGTIETESSRDGSTCSLVIMNSCIEKKIKETIEKEQAKNQVYSLKFYNCYNWANFVISTSNL
jgi:RHS repeat-associated protein